jgi:hypothetical protein
MNVRPYLRFYLAYALAGTVGYMLLSLLFVADPTLVEAGRYLYAAWLIGGGVAVFVLAAMNRPGA